MAKLKQILLLILGAFLYFCRWLWKDHTIWAVLVITSIISAFFVDPLVSLIVFVFWAIPGAFISWNLWIDKRRRRGKCKW